MATYNINKITLPSGDICNLQDSNAITDVQLNGSSVVSNGVANINILDDFASTGYDSATGTSGAITVKTYTITEAGIYAFSGTSYQTRNNYTTAQQAGMNSALTVMRANSGGTNQESYSQRAVITGGGDNCVSAIMQCSVGDTIKFNVQQTVGNSGATLSEQTFYVRSSMIRLV